MEIMGSGNKEKRKKGQAREPAGGFSPVKKGEMPPEPGVRFELEPDSDRIFQDSMRRWDADMPDDDDFEEIRPPARVKSGPVEIDLHRMTLNEAIWRVDAEIDDAVASGHQTTFKIITGKGLHSGPSGGVLAREIHRHIAERYARHIQAIDESPADVTIGGVPLRGHFVVTIRKS